MPRSLAKLAISVLFVAGCLSAQSDKLDSNIPDDSTTIEVFVRMADQLFKSGADYPAFCEQNKNAKLDLFPLKTNCCHPSRLNG